MVVASVAAALCGASALPMQYLAAPRWSVRVVNEAGEPIEGMTVRMTWENYSVEDAGHEKDLVSDRNGAVIFPSERSSASLLRRLFYSGLSSMALAHASYGPHATVFTFGQNRKGDAIANGIVVNWNGSPAEMRSEIVARLR